MKTPFIYVWHIRSVFVCLWGIFFRSKRCQHFGERIVSLGYEVLWKIPDPQDWRAATYTSLMNAVLAIPSTHIHTDAPAHPLQSRERRRNQGRHYQSKNCNNWRRLPPLKIQEKGTDEWEKNRENTTGNICTQRIHLYILRLSVFLTISYTVIGLSLHMSLRIIQGYTGLTDNKKTY